MGKILNTLDQWQDAIGSNNFMAGLIIGSILSLTILAVASARKHKKDHEDPEGGLGI